MNFKTSRGKKPPGSGQPVPGTNAASRQSTSKDSQTASVPSQATSNARCAAASMPISTQSVTVMIVVPRSRPTCTPGRGACQPPMPICTRFCGGTLGMSVA
jgi:hypothetical protein